MLTPYQSPYQVLDNRPLDQWKVTELKEELRKRRLTIKGLKEDLVKRLDEAVRTERENAAPEESEKSESEDNGQEDAAENMGGSVSCEADNTGGSVVEETVTTVETSIVVTESVESEVQEITESENSKVPLVVGEIETQLEGDENSEPRSEAALENQVSELVSENSESRGESKNQVENNNNSEGKFGEVTLGDSATDNQVYEVSPNLGSPVKCDSISTDSVSINEKIEIKDNIIADNVKLELDNVKPSVVVPIGGESHPRPMDVEEPHPHGEKAHDISDTDADLSKKFDSLDDVGDSEKLNLDRSSGDESMEEDVLDSKQVDSKYRLDDDIMSEKIEESDVKKEGGSVDIVGDPTEKKAMDAPAEKRKLHDQSLVGNTDNVKRQRRWNTESIKVPEPQNSNITLSSTPKDTFQSPASKGLSSSDSVITDDAPKERVVPPSPKPPTNSLKVDRFVRPFTLKAVQELLGKTGNVVSFWMDRIKTHCYVTYSSVEEAVETRDAVYNLQWPSNGGRNLTAEFVDPQEVKNRLEVPPPPSPATTPGGSQPHLRPVMNDPPPPPPPSLLPPPPPLQANPNQPRERLPPPPPLLEEESNLDPPIVTLDDLFRKTKASPRIYYLPLSDEQVAARAAAKQ